MWHHQKMTTFNRTARHDTTRKWLHSTGSKTWHLQKMTTFYRTARRDTPRKWLHLTGQQDVTLPGNNYLQQSGKMWHCQKMTEQPEQPVHTHIVSCATYSLFPASHTDTVLCLTDWLWCRGGHLPFTDTVLCVTDWLWCNQRLCFMCDRLTLMKWRPPAPHIRTHCFSCVTDWLWCNGGQSPHSLWPSGWHCKSICSTVCGSLMLLICYFFTVDVMLLLHYWFCCFVSCHMLHILTAGVTLVTTFLLFLLHS